MKKKKRFLALIFSLLLVFLTGCGNGGPGGIPGFTPEGEEPADPDTPVDLLGVKVLSKPESYDFGAALGDNSVNYYNLFAWNILRTLYDIYEAGAETLNAKAVLELVEKNEGNTANGFTFGNTPTEKKENYYLYDSIRYTIESVDTNDDSATQTITLKYNDWNWSIPADAQGYEILFKSSKNGNENIFQENGNQYIYNLSGYDDWTQESLNIPDFSEFYYFKGNSINSGSNSYYPSPFSQSDFANENDFPQYQPKIEGDFSNYFQDALEYVTYLFVLGYDYSITEDAPLFDFEIRYQDDKPNIQVGGWGNTKISVEDALGRVKKMYQEDGGYVGLTEKNRQQIVNFILDKVIGADAIGNRDGEFEVEIKQNGISTGNPLKFDRRYSEIVENIVKYACQEVAIGTTKDEDGNSKPLNLDGEPYPTSVITDYRGDYFASAPSDQEGEEDMLRYISPAEYQSIVLYPNPDDLSDGPFQLNYFSLMIEYWDNEHDTWEEYNASSIPQDAKRYLKEITITVGLRVFSKSQNKLIIGNPDNIVEVQKTIPFESASKYVGLDEYEDFYGRHNIQFCDTDEGDVDAAFGENVMIETAFNQNIGSGAINPFAYEGFNASLFYKSIPVSGNNSARAYYKINESRSYGFFGSLNEEMFGGDDGCDYIEIYFDIQKAKGVTGANYNFKVSVDTILKDEDV